MFQEKQYNRRWFLSRAAIGLGLVSASLIGFDHFRNTAESVAPKTIQTEIAADFATLDAAYATLGRSKIEAFIATDNPEIMKRSFLWICSRSHSGMYDLICSGLADRRPEVGAAALSALRQVDPVDLKSHITLMMAQMNSAQDSLLRSNISDLIMVVESS